MRRRWKMNGRRRVFCGMHSFVCVCVCLCDETNKMRTVSAYLYECAYELCVYKWQSWTDDLKPLQKRKTGFFENKNLKWFWIKNPRCCSHQHNIKDTIQCAIVVVVWFDRRFARALHSLFTHFFRLTSFTFPSLISTLLFFLNYFVVDFVILIIIIGINRSAKLKSAW